jgi:uncharacterized damage-inducible protein DinB
MNIPEFFVKRWEAEQPAFLKVLQAMPADLLQYTPHERSSKAGDLAWQLALEQRGLAEIVRTGEMDWPTAKRPESLAEIIAAWESATSDLRQALQGFDEAKAAAPAEMKMGGESAWKDTVGGMLWGFLLDMIHHRGQLSTYLRPMGGKVPAIYGPSADSES